MTLIITRSACEDGNNGGCLVKAFRDVDGKVVWERSCCSEASCQEKVIIIIIIAIVIGVVIIPLRDLASNCLIPAWPGQWGLHWKVNEAYLEYWCSTSRNVSVKQIIILKVIKKQSSIIRYTRWIWIKTLKFPAAEQTTATWWTQARVHWTTTQF